MAQMQFRNDDTTWWPYKFGDGSDGAHTSSGNLTWNPTRASCSGSASSSTLSLGSSPAFTDGMLVMIHQTRGTGAGGWELNKISSGGGSSTLTMVHALTNTYTDSGASQAQVTRLYEYTDFTLGSGHTYTATAWDGNDGGIICFAVSGTCTIEGTITGAGKGYRGGNSAPYQGQQGESAVGAGGSTRDEDYVRNGAGGGGGSGNNHATDEKSHGNAGGGANGANGQTGYDAYAHLGGRYTPQGGLADGNAGLTDMVFGGGGGGSANVNDGGYWGSSTGMDGGDGGGIVMILANTISVTGSITCDGGDENSRTDSRMGFGGGGGGGSILIKAQTATLGSGLITADGGNCAGTNGNGGDGRIHLDYMVSTSGTTSPSLNSTQDFSLRTGASSSTIFG